MTPRPLNVIASEIARTWTNVWYGAEPYLSAMRTLSSIHDRYGAVTGDDIVRRFLLNAATWRGDDARRIKSELKSILKGN